MISPNNLAVMQGYTDKTETHFVIVSAEKQLYCTATETTKPNETLLPTEENDISYKESLSHVHQCSFNKLDHKKNYELIVFDKNKNIIANRFFKTLDISKPQITIAIESCTSDIVHLPLLWDNLKSKQPDYIFMIGDNVYGDLFHEYTEITHSHLWERYARSWRVFKVFQQKHLTPVLAIWDDHDFGKNNSDSSFENKEFTLFLFRTFFNQNKETSNLSQGPGASFTFSIAKNSFIFLDSRYFRDANSNSAGSYFSNEQAIWVKKQFEKNSTNTFWLISGSQWFGTKGQDESFEINHPETIYDFFKAINFEQYTIHLISGDSHFSEIKKVNIQNKSAYEITSSGMHALPIGTLEPDSRRFYGSNLPNYVIADINLLENKSHIFTAYTLFNIKLFSMILP